MEMHQVRYFLAVADSLNFTRAAEYCHVSHPALTRAIQQLEEELDGLLLRRERKLIHLTDFGRLIEPHLRQVAADAEDEDDGEAVSQSAAGANPPRRHVHRRAGAVHWISGKFPGRQRCAAVEDADIVEAEKTALEDVAAVGVLTVHPR